MAHRDVVAGPHSVLDLDPISCTLNLGSFCKFKNGVHTPCILGVLVLMGCVILLIFLPLRFLNVSNTFSTAFVSGLFLRQIWCRVVLC